VSGGRDESAAATGCVGGSGLGYDSESRQERGGVVRESRRVRMGATRLWTPEDRGGRELKLTRESN
jgi:hypothetical protein